MLEGVCLQRASGALEIEGQPGGVVYLDSGDIIYAQAEWSPDLGARLVGLLGPAPGLRELLSADARSAADLGPLLVDRGYISGGDLAQLVRSLIVDAVFVLTAPLAVDAWVDRTRLVTGASHWAAALGRLAAPDVLTEARRHAGLLADYPLTQSDRFELCDLPAGSAVLTADQWTLAGLMTGEFTVRDLAWAAGISLHETVRCVGDLAQAGLCRPCPPDPGAEDRPGQVAGAPATVTELPPRRTPSKRTPSRSPSPTAANSGLGVRSMPRRKPAASADPTRARSAARSQSRSADAGTQPSRAVRSVRPDPTGARAPITGENRPAGQADGSRPAGDQKASPPADADRRAEPEFTPLPVESLRRVLNGLRNLK